MPRGAGGDPGAARGGSGGAAGGRGESGRGRSRETLHTWASAAPSHRGSERPGGSPGGGSEGAAAPRHRRQVRAPKARAEGSAGVRVERGADDRGWSVPGAAALPLWERTGPGGCGEAAGRQAGRWWRGERPPPGRGLAGRRRGGGRAVSPRNQPGGGAAGLSRPGWSGKFGAAR